MNHYDWYYRQLVGPSELDQAFHWTADALEAFQQAVLADDGASWNGGILAGGAVTQQIVPDLSVRVGAIVAVAKDGKPIIDATVQTTVPVDVDEYGTATAVTTPGQSRIISVFVRYRTNPQTPAVDGDGLTVYTHQLDDLECFVRMGTAAVSPAPPALLPDALLLADITRAFAQTTVTTGDIDDTRREDWLRLVGTTITSFVAGTPREALRLLFGYVDTAMGGGSAYTPANAWYGAVALGAVAGTPPTTVMGGLDCIVQDLASTVYGGALVGSAAVTGTAGARADMIANSVRGHIGALATLLASHGAACVNLTGRIAWRWLQLSHTVGFAAGPISSVGGGTATAVLKLGTESGWVLVHSLTGVWTTGGGVDYANPYVAAEAYLLQQTSMDDWLTTTDWQTVAYALASEVAELNCRGREVAAYLYGTEAASALRQDGSHLGGSCHAQGPLVELERGYTTDDDDPAWALPYQTYVECAAGNLVDICRGWDYRRNIGCAYAVGDVLKVSKIYCDAGAVSGLTEEWMSLTIDAAGTLMSTLFPVREPYAVACNGEKIFVLVSSAAAGSAAEIYAYDARVWRSSGLAQWLWTAVVPFTTNCLGVIKVNSALTANQHYVVALLGDEDCNTGSPLCRVSAVDGTGGIIGKGDGAAAVGSTPRGGLAISRATVAANCRIFYTTGDSFTPVYYCVPSDYDLSATGVTRFTLGFVCRSIALPGRYVVLPEFENLAAGSVYVSVWDWETDDKVGLKLELKGLNTTYHDTYVSFDGTTLWFKICHALGGEQHVVLGVHAAEMVHTGIAGEQEIVVAQRPSYSVNGPQSGAYGTMGRFVAWTSGQFHIMVYNASNRVAFLPHNRGCR